MILSNRKNINKIQLIYFVSVIVLFCSLVLALPRISIPLSLAYILSLALTPIVSSLMALRMSKTMATLFIFIVLGFLVGWPLVKMIPMLSTESQNFQDIIPKIEEYIILQFQYLREFVKIKTGHEIGDAYVYQGLQELQNWSTSAVVRIPNILANLKKKSLLYSNYHHYILLGENILLLTLYLHLF